MTTRTVLLQARALVAQGWTQGVMYSRRADGSPCWCALGAIEARAGSFDDWQDAKRAMFEHLPRNYVSLTDWNDAHGRTQSEVLDLFDRAIAAQGVDNG